MNDARSNGSLYGPGHLADYLAELLKQFRHFSSPLESAPKIGPSLARIRVSARLLSKFEVVDRSIAESFTRLGGVLQEWVDFFGSSPETLPDHLVSPLTRLADFLEVMMARCDQGTAVAELARDPGWSRLLATFRHAGTPLAVLEDVEDLFTKWGLRWNDQNLTPVQEQSLRRRWLSMRKHGDVLFRVNGGRQAWQEDDPEASGKQGIMMLIDSNFRRDLVRDKLTNRGFRVEVPCDPVQALEFLASGSRPRAILCDNLEPTRHLVRVKEGLASLRRGKGIPLILVVGSTLAGSSDQDRAFSLGAVAAWREPFDPIDLERILQHLSQP
jgi:CheY-like chemotaxis protein